MRDGIGALVAVDPARLSRDEAFDHLVAVDAAVARLCAARERALAALDDPDDPKSFVRDEVACALRWSFGYTASRLHQATTLVERLSRILALEEQGLIGEAQVRAVVEATCSVDPAVLPAVEERVLGRASGQTPTQVTASVRRAVAKLDPRSAEQRHKDAKKHEKTARLTALPDGLAGIWSVHDAVTAAAMFARICELAKQPTAPEDERRVDERRADALAQVVLGIHPDGTLRTRPLVQVLAPAVALAGTSDAPGELVGYGPIPAGLCRAVLNTDRVLIEAIRVAAHGTVLAPPDVDDQPWFRFPSAKLARHVVAAWPTCRFPGCNRTAIGCELDHLDPYTGANTVAANLQPLCPRHHHVKTRSRLERVPRPARGHRVDLTHRPGPPQTPRRAPHRRPLAPAACPGPGCDRSTCMINSEVLPDPTRTRR